MDQICLQFDQKHLITSKQYLIGIPFFSKIFSEPELFGTGEINDPIQLDYNYKNFYHIIEYQRNGEQYQLKNRDIYIYNKLFEPNDIPVKKDFVSINIGHKIFITTVLTLTKLEYFNSLINKFKNLLPKFLDRNASIFKHIIAHLRNPYHVIPEKYFYELDFYGKITHPDFVFEKETYEIPSNTPIINHTFDFNNQINLYINGAPQITFFKMVYRRCTDFKKSDMIVSGIQNKNIITFTIDKNNNQNLITGEFYLFVPKEFIIKIEMKFGNTLMDRNSIELINFLEKNYYDDSVSSDLKNESCTELYFYNKNNYGLSLPIIALNNSITIEVTLNTENETNAKLCYEYVKLDVEESRRFKQVSHEYLIKQWLEYETDFISSKTSHYIDIRGVIDMIYFEIKPTDVNVTDVLVDGNISVNNVMIKYINPFLSKKNYKKIKNKSTDNTYLILFCINVKKYQPSGHENFMHGFTLNLNLLCDSGKIKIYARQYNVMHIVSGLVGYKHPFN